MARVKRSREEVKHQLEIMADHVKQAKECGSTLYSSPDGSKGISAVVNDGFFDHIKQAKECGSTIYDILEGSKRISAVVDDGFFDLMDRMLEGSVSADEAYKELEDNYYFDAACI